MRACREGTEAQRSAEFANGRPLKTFQVVTRFLAERFPLGLSWKPSLEPSATDPYSSRVRPKDPRASKPSLDGITMVQCFCHDLDMVRMLAKLLPAQVSAGTCPSFTIPRSYFEGWLSNLKPGQPSIPFAVENSNTFRHPYLHAIEHSPRVPPCHGQRDPWRLA